MGGLIVVVFIVVLIVCWLVIRSHFERIEERLSVMDARVRELEARPETPPVEAPLPAPIPEPVVVAHEEPKPIAPLPPPLPPPLPAYVKPAPIAPLPPLGPSFSDRLRQTLGNEEWEALIGGSILNKIGAVVLVIGLALFLAYSFTYMRPAGRAAICIAGSVALLAAGVQVERRARYRVFARGLIGAGWAGMYATSYAIYALPAARIIESPFAGSVVMLLVAAGMIAHSLRYRTQAVTGVAYAAAFAALAATPSTPFAVVSLIPLAASILYLANAFEWNAMALFGLVATYATCIARGNSNAPLASTQALFLAYWVLFEAFDLLRVRRRSLSGGIEWIFPLNAAAFLGLSYIAWAHHAPDRLWLASAYAAALYLASAIIRAVLRPPATFENGEGLLARMRAGSYEGALLVAAVLAALAVMGRVPGVWKSAGLALEAEIIYLAGVRFRATFLRRLGGGAFVVSLASVLWHNLPAEETSVLGRPIWNWTPAVLFHAFLFYVNRGLFRAHSAFTYGAAGLLMLVLGAECPSWLIGTAWLLLAAVLFEIGSRARLREFGIQAYLIGGSGAIMTAIAHASGSPHRLWIPLTASLALVYGNILRVRLAKGSESAALSTAKALATALLAVLLLWRTVPGDYVALAWCALAVVLFELALWKLPAELRAVSWCVAALGGTAVVITHADGFGKYPADAVTVSWFGAALCAWAFTARLLSRREETFLRDVAALVGVLFALPALWMVTPDVGVAVCWAALAIAWLELGSLLRVDSFRWLGSGILLPMIAWELAVNFYDPHYRLIVASAGIGTCYYFWRRTGGLRVRPVFSLLGTLLLTALLYHQVSDRMLTVACGVEGVALLAAGFPLRERVLRLQGLVLLLACILKLFIYDLRNLETMYRILSFVALGLILLAVSWVYTRFGERLRRLL
jgi:hypothetical protein